MKPLCFALICIFGFLEAREVVLVTGASRGIGYEIADFLTKEGYCVYAGARTAPVAAPKGYQWIELDVTDQNSIDHAVKNIIEREGRIDVLVNNAGIIVYGSLENVTIEEAKAIFDVNFFGMMRITQAVLPHMREQNGGKIIQMSSRSGFRPLPSISVYAASKFALEGISESMAALLKPWNIDIVLIEPGPVDTLLDYFAPYGSHLPQDQDPYYLIFEKAGLLNPDCRSIQTPQEIAKLVKEVIETDQPHFRYQTTPAIQKQAGQRFVDPTGDSAVKDWMPILFPLGIENAKD